MKVLFAAGGTAGHIHPALAIAEGMKERWPHAEISFAGRPSGMERRIVKLAGYPFFPIEVEGFQRSFSAENLKRNLKAISLLAAASIRAKAILRILQPDLVVGTGGFVSGPLVHAAARIGIPTAIHEQNAFPGKANRWLAKKVNVILAPTASAIERLGYPEKCILVGNPVRGEFLRQNREQNRQRLGVGNRTLVVSFGGSNGAQRLNEAAAALAEWHLSHCDFMHIHATGHIEKEAFAKLAASKGLLDRPGFEIREYIDDMPALLSAADLVISRAGASTLAELAAVGRASLLIPSPHVAENHQYFNALEFEKVGAARIIEEKDLTDEKLISVVQELTSEPSALASMGTQAHSLACPQTLQLIVDALEQLVRESGFGS